MDVLARIADGDIPIARERRSILASQRRERIDQCRDAQPRRERSYAIERFESSGRIPRFVDAFGLAVAEFQVAPADADATPAIARTIRVVLDVGREPGRERRVTPAIQESG